MIYLVNFSFQRDRNNSIAVISNRYFISIVFVAFIIFFIVVINSKYEPYNILMVDIIYCS